MGHQIYCTADSHLANHREFSTLLADGTNSRLKVGCDVLKYIIDRAANQVLVIAGDLFHDRESIDISVLKAASEVIEYAASKCAYTYLLAGNHDQYLAHGNIHSLQAFRNFRNVSVIDQPCYVSEIDSVMMPYMKDYDAWRREWAKVPIRDITCTAFLHADIIGAEMNGGFMASRGVDLATLQSAHIPTIISGHYHKPQTLAPGIHYVGSPYQLDRAEAGQQKRYMVCDADRCESFPITGFPEFTKVRTIEAARKASDDGNFVDISCSLAEAEKLVRLGKPSNVNMVLIRANADVLITHVPLGINEAVCEDLRLRGREDLIEKALSRLVI